MSITHLMHENGRDVRKPLGIDFDPAAHDTPESAAKALYAAMVCFAQEGDEYTPDEVTLYAPDSRPDLTGDQPHGWLVCWEGGPERWAYSEICGKWGYTNPHWSFLVEFVLQEAKRADA